MECNHTKPTDAAVSVLDAYVRNQLEAVILRAARVIEARRCAYVRQPGTVLADGLANAHHLHDDMLRLRRFCPACLSRIGPKLVSLMESAEGGRMVGIIFGADVKHS